MCKNLQCQEWTGVRKGYSTLSGVHWRPLSIYKNLFCSFESWSCVRDQFVLLVLLLPPPAGIPCPLGAHPCCSPAGLVASQAH